MYLIMCSAKHLPSYVLFFTFNHVYIHIHGGQVHCICTDFLTKETNGLNLALNFKK